MIEISGTLNGKTYKEDLISAEALIKTFNLELPEGESVVFNLDGGEITYDAANGRNRHSIRRGLLPSVKGVRNGETFQLRYYEQKSKNSNGNPQYSPARIDFRGKQAHFSKDGQLEQAVILMLREQCAQSPIRKPSSRTEYYVYDRHAKADSEIQYHEMMQHIRELILNETTDLKAIHLARGLRINGRGIPKNKITTATEARVEMLRWAESDPFSVIDALQNEVTMIRGIVLDCVDKGGIEKEQRGQATTWRWSDNVANGEMIVQAKQNQVAEEVLIQFFLAPGVFTDYYSYMERALSEETEIPDGEELGIHDPEGVKPKAKLSPKQQSVMKMFSEGKIAYIPDRRGLYKLDEKGQPIGRRILELKKDDWKTELFRKLNNKVYNSIKEAAYEDA